MKSALFFFFSLPLLFLLPSTLGVTEEKVPRSFQTSLRQELGPQLSYSSYGGSSSSREFTGGGKFQRYRFKTLLSLETPEHTRLALGVGFLYGRAQGGPFEGTQGGNSVNHFPSEYTFELSREFQFFPEFPFSKVEGGLDLHFPGKNPRGPHYLRSSNPHPYYQANLSFQLPPSLLLLKVLAQIRLRRHLSDQYLGGLAWEHPLERRLDLSLSLLYLHTGSGLTLGGNSFNQRSAELGYPPYELLRERFLQGGLRLFYRPGKKFHYDLTLGQKFWGRNTAKTTDLSLGMTYFL